MTDYERIGGEETVNRLITAFLDLVQRDFIIGFLFEGRDMARIHRHEVEHASRLLGGPVVYTGRPIGAAHRGLHVNRGHFRRRLAILRTVLGQQGVPDDVIERWIAHDARLEPAVTDGTDCVGDR